MEYWNSTKDVTKTQRTVDAVILPLAPFPAARREKYTYYGYSVWVNTLDYSSVVVPVTTVDKGVDKKIEGFNAVDEQDQKTQDTCESPFPAVIARPRPLRSGWRGGMRGVKRSLLTLSAQMTLTFTMARM